MISVIRERMSKVVSSVFSKLYYTCVVDDSGDHRGNLCVGKKQRYHLRSLSFHDTSARARSSIIIQGGPSEVIQSNISKTSRDREKCFV